MKKSILVSFVTLAMSAPSFLNAITDATWLGGAWNNNGNWSYNQSPNTFPNGIDTTARFASASGMTSLGQAITVGHVVVTGGVPEFNSADSFTFSVSSGNATLTGSGAGAFHLFTSAAVPLLSPLTISGGGSDINFNAYFTGDQELTVTGGLFQYFVTTVGPTPLFTGNLNVESTGVIEIQAFDAFTLPATFGGLTGTGLIQVATDRLTINSVNSSTFNGTLQSVGGGTGLVKQGTATLALGGTGSMDVLSLNEGTISASSLNNLANPTAIQFFETPASTTATLQITGSSPFTYGNAMSFGNMGISEFDIDPTTALTLSGALTGGAGANVRKTGQGSLIVSGVQNFTAPITVLEGTLTISGSIANPLTVSGGVFNVPGSTSGTTTVNNGGTFTIAGSTSASTTVNSGGLLKGTGSLQTVTVNSGGTIAPGNSIGTLNVATLNLNAGSITQIEISPTDSSQILVSGVATLGGSVSVVQQSGTYGSSGSYPILVASGGLSGEFNPTVIGGSPGFTFSLDYSLATNTVLLLYGFTGIPTTNLTGQADRFARYLNRNVPSSSATSALLAVPAGQLQAALDSASPSRNAFAPFAIQNTMVSLSDLVSGHLVDQRFYHAQKRYNPNVAALMDHAASFTADASGRMVLPRTCESQSVWVGVIGEYAHQDSLDQNPAFHFWSGGSMIGWDFYGDQNLVGFGGGAAYTHLIQDENAGNAKINYYFASLYDTFYGPCDFPLYIELALWGVYNQIHNYRNISFPGFEGTASATFHSWELVPHFGIGYLANYCCFSLEPFAQFDLVVDWQQGFREHGVGDFDMTHVSRNSQFLRSEGGLRLYKIKQLYWGAWMGMVRGSFINKKAFGTGSVSAAIVGTNALFSVETFRNTQNLGSIGLESLWRWGQRNPVTLSLAYNGEFGSQFWSQEGMIRLMKDF